MFVAMRSLIVLLATLALGAALAACDSKANTSDTSARADQLSKEYESCGATLHCDDGLRCFAHECGRTKRSNLGDYYAAYGANKLAKGDTEAAITAYSQALGQYNVAKIPLPPDIDCGYGGALAAGKTNHDHAELAAKVLHRCLLAVPPGGALRDHALAQLATLQEAGLDPVLIGADKLADVYLTKKPATPATDKLVISVAALPVPTGKSWAKVPEAMASPALRPSLISCWSQFNAQTHKAALSVSLGVKVTYAANPDYENEGAWITRFDTPPATARPVDTCVRSVVEPAIKDLKLRDRMDSRVTISIK